MPGAARRRLRRLVHHSPGQLAARLVFPRLQRGLRCCTRFYGRTVGWCLRLSAVVLLLYVGLLGLTYFGYTKVPSGFIPNQDKGYLIANVQLPDSASQARTIEVMDQIQKIVQRHPGVAHIVDIPGQSFVMNGVSSNFGSVFIILKPFHERRSPELYSEAIANDLRGQLFMAINQAQVLVFGAPAVDGLGNAGGFKLMLESTGNTDLPRPRSGDRQSRRQGERAAGFHRPVQQLPRVDAAALRRRRSRQMQDDEGGAQRRLRYAAGLPGQLLRQRHQPLWPDLAGQRPGRRAVSHQCRDGEAVPRPQRQRRHGAARFRGDDPRRPGSGVRPALQHADGHGDQRRGDAQRQLRVGDRDDGAAVQEGAAAQHGF